MKKRQRRKKKQKKQNKIGKISVFQLQVYIIDCDTHVSKVNLIAPKKVNSFIFLNG